MLEPLIKTGIYKHYKKGDLYFVTGTVIHAETDKNLVIYHSLYKESVAFVRSLFNFCEPLCPNAEQAISILDDYEVKIVKRFELVKELDPKYCKMLLPGSIVRHVGFRNLQYMVLNCIFDVKKSGVLVNVSDISGTSEPTFDCDTFLKNCVCV